MLIALLEATAAAEAATGNEAKLSIVRFLLLLA